MLSHYTADFIKHFPFQKDWKPWEVTSKIPDSIYAKIATLPEKEYTIIDGIAIHKTAVIEKGVTLKAPVIIAENCFIGATGVEKFGALVGDNTKVGANAVLSPGTLLVQHSVVKRLELVTQVP